MSTDDVYVVIISFTQTYHTVNLKELSSTLADNGEVALVGTISAQRKGYAVFSNLIKKIFTICL